MAAGRRNIVLPSLMRKTKSFFLSAKGKFLQISQHTQTHGASPGDDQKASQTIYAISIDRCGRVRGGSIYVQIAELRTNYRRIGSTRREDMHALSVLTKNEQLVVHLQPNDSSSPRNLFCSTYHLHNAIILTDSPGTTILNNQNARRQFKLETIMLPPSCAMNRLETRHTYMQTMMKPKKRTISTSRRPTSNSRVALSLYIFIRNSNLFGT